MTDRFPDGIVGELLVVGAVVVGVIVVKKVTRRVMRPVYVKAAAIHNQRMAEKAAASEQ